MPTAAIDVHWPKIQAAYNALIASGKSNDDSLRELRKTYAGLGPKNQERLKNGYNAFKKSSPSKSPDKKPSSPSKSSDKKPSSPRKSPVKTVEVQRSKLVDGQLYESSQTEFGLHPKILTVGSMRHAYQCPNDPKGLVVFLHGCARSIYGGWPRSSDSKFLGFPEGVSRTKQALRLGYAVLYISPVDTKTGCFSSKTDTKNVQDAIKCASACIPKRPIYIFGCSAGGGLAQRLVASGAVKCSGMVNESATSADSTRNTPMSVWIAMSTAKEQKIATERVVALRKLKVPAEMLVCPKRRITDDYFSDQISSIHPTASRSITSSLKRTGLINSDGNVLKEPKDDKKWYNQLGNVVKTPETSIGFWNSSIAQAVMVAWSHHDECSMYTTACLKWFESGGAANLKSLASKYAITKPAYFSAK